MIFIPPSLISQLGLAATQKLINRTIDLDECAREKIDAMPSTVLIISLKQPAISVSCIIRNGKLELREGELTGAPITETLRRLHITSDVQTLARLFKSDDKEQILQEEQIYIDGEIRVFFEIRDLIRNLDIDWETHLQGQIGYLPTKALITIWRGIQSTGRALSSQFRS